MQQAVTTATKSIGYMNEGVQFYGHVFEKLVGYKSAESILKCI